MKKCVLAVSVLTAIVISFILGSWYAIQYADVQYDAAKGLHSLEVFGRSEYWHFEQDEEVRDAP